MCCVPPPVAACGSTLSLPAPLSCSTPAITIIGNVTVDVVDGNKALGGAVSYAAAVASALGVRACIVTARGPHDASIDRDFSALFEVGGCSTGAGAVWRVLGALADACLCRPLPRPCC